MAPGLRIIDWNLQKRKNVARQMHFMDSLWWDILRVQEVLPQRVRLIENHPYVDSIDTSRHPDQLANLLTCNLQTSVSPRLDHPDLEQCDWFWEAEERVYGPDPKHDLQDVFRVYLGANEPQMAAIRAERPTGPLATSFLRGHTTPARYDAIYASPEFSVIDVEYHWEDAREAGSDHGLVWARLEWDHTFVAPAGKRFPITTEDVS